MHVAGQRPPGLDLPLQLVDRRHTDAPPREHDREQLGTGEVEHALARPRAQPLDRPRQLEVAARIERDDDAHHRLAAIPVPDQVAQAEPDALGPEAAHPRTNKPLQPVITLAPMSGAAAEGIWTDAAIADLRRELGDVYEGRTALVTGADGFMGSHLTEALVELGADVVAFVRATSSGALNNIGHLRPRLRVKFADLTDRTSVDYLVRELKQASDRPYIFHLGAQAHVGESWHRPYETVMANVVGTLNLLQSILDHELDVERFDTAGTSEEYGNPREAVQHQHDFDSDGGVVFHERSPINPKSVYATSKVAADFLTMNYHDAFGIPGVVTRMFNNYGPRQNPRFVTGTIITQALERPRVELGQLEPLRDLCYCTDGVRGHLMVAAHGKPGDVYVYGQGENISMRDWGELILRVGEEEGHWPGDRELVSFRSAIGRAQARCSR